MSFRRRKLGRYILGCAIFCTLSSTAKSQVNVTTHHNDIARTGANTAETVLTPQNVNTTQFGKLFSHPVNGQVYAQPLYVAGVTMGAGTPQSGTTHNVVFVATEHDSVYAFDADNITGANANPLWAISLLDSAHGATSGATTLPSDDVGNAALLPEIGITSTPVIDTTTHTIYVLGVTRESVGTGCSSSSYCYVHRLHALDISTGAEKFGGPTTLSGSVAGLGTGSSGGILKFDSKWHLSRAGLLLLNGIVYMSFASHNDNGPWHGWIFAYNAATMQQTGAWCASPNGSNGGIWLSGGGLAAEVIDPVNHPYGRMYTATGNGTFDAVPPYSNSQDFGDSLIKLDLANGVPTMNSGGTVVGDDFTPYNQATLETADTDLASGGVLILPDQTSGGHTHLLFHVSKEAKLRLVDRDNMGGYNSGGSSNPQIVQEVFGLMSGVWSAPAYWNGKVYVSDAGSNIFAFPLVSGRLNTTSYQDIHIGTTYFPGVIPTISANGTSNGILWGVRTEFYNVPGPSILYAFDATNIATKLYSSDQNASRDTPGNAVKFAVPTVVQGKVYVGTAAEVSAYGLLNGATQTATPVFSPSSQSFAPSIQITMTDGTSGAAIYYTTDGSTPSTSSTAYSGPFTLNSTTTVNVIAIASGFLASPVATATYTLSTQAVMPVFNPPPGSYSSEQSVSISSTTPNSTIYYTTDGSTPTTSSTRYTGPVVIALDTSVTLSAIAAASGLSNSPVARGVYNLTSPAATPVLSPGQGTYAAGQQVTISDATDGATIYYTTNGVGPTTSSTLYTGPITVNSSETIQAIAVAAEFSQSAIGSATYTITTSATATPTFSPAGGSYTTTQTVTISDATSGATIYYTTNGTTPTTGSTVYAGPITVSATETIEAIAVASGHTQSAVGSAAYNIGAGGPAATPKLTPGQGTYAAGQQVAISDATPGATLYYTTNGVGPTTSSAVYTGPITVNSSETIQAIAVATGFTQSAIGSATYTISTSAAATPTFSPSGGTYTTAQTVTISDTTSGATIYYTTNGTTPTTGSAVYTGPITVSATETIEAIALATGYAQSPIGIATYTISTSATATPTFSPSGGTYSTAQTVTISDTTSGATIYYTTNGTTPTTSSTPYSSPITVSATETIEAIAVASGHTQSAVGSAAYTIATGGPAATPKLTPGQGTYAAGQQVTITDATPGATLYYTTNGVGPTTTSAVYTGPITVNSSETIEAIAVATGFTQSAIGSATYTISTSAAATPTFSPSGGTYATAQTVTISDATSGATIYYTTNGTTPTTSSTQYSVPITVSATETIEAIAVASGHTQSAVGSAAYTISTGGAAATPRLTPGQGTYAAGQQVTISDTTTGATIYYTTNGVGPTTSSTLYTGPITVNATETIQAIAVATGYTQSAIGSATYTITTSVAATPTFSPSGGTYTTAQTVTISDTTSGATIYYTTNGTTPTTASAVYSGPITVSATETIEAIAVATGYTQSGVGSAAYTITTGSQAATPILSPGQGTYAAGQQVTISDATSGATIYYTTNGVGPTTSSTLYTGPITVNATETIQAIAVATGYTQSAIGSATYTISTATPAATPKLTPAQGTYSAGQQVTISDATIGATIYYTTNGVRPTTSSAVYTGPITVNKMETIEAIAVAPGYTQSAVGSATYKITGQK